MLLYSWFVCVEHIRCVVVCRGCHIALVHCWDGVCCHCHWLHQLAQFMSALFDEKLGREVFYVCCYVMMSTVPSDG